MLFCLLAAVVNAGTESCVPFSSCNDDEIRKLSLLTNGLKSTHTAESGGCNFEYTVTLHSTMSDLYQSK